MMQALRVRFSDFVDKFTDLGCWFLGSSFNILRFVTLW